MKRSEHLKTREKCRKHSPAARVFYISLVFSNARRVLSQCNTRVRLLYLLNIGNEKKFYCLLQKEVFPVGAALQYHGWDELCQAKRLSFAHFGLVSI